VYLTRKHQPQGKEVVWEVVQGAFGEVIGANYVLIAHSLGSIISAYLIGYGFVNPPSVFVTVGSQLGWQALVRLGWLLPFHLDGIWINIIDKRDASSGFFSRDRTPKDNGFTAHDYRDLWVTNTNSENAHDFRGYMRTAGALANVSPLL